MQWLSEVRVALENFNICNENLLVVRIKIMKSIVKLLGDVESLTIIDGVEIFDRKG